MYLPQPALLLQYLSIHPASASSAGQPLPLIRLIAATWSPSCFLAPIKPVYRFGPFTRRHIFFPRHPSALLRTDFMVVTWLSVLTVSSRLCSTKCYYLPSPIASFAFALPGPRLPGAVWCFEKQRALMSATGVCFGCPHLTVCLFLPALSAPLPADLLQSRRFLVQEMRLPLNGPVAFPKSHTCNCWHFPLATLNCSLAQLLLSLPPGL